MAMSQQLTPKNLKKGKWLNSTTKSLSGGFNMNHSSSKFEKKRTDDKKASPLKNCQDKIDYYQKVLVNIIIYLFGLGGVFFYILYFRKINYLRNIGL